MREVRASRNVAHCHRLLNVGTPPVKPHSGHTVSSGFTFSRPVNGPDLTANSLCHGPEKRTMRQSERLVGISDSKLQDKMGELEIRIPAICARMHRSAGQVERFQIIFR